jgi:GT2 family glycosyltransferase
MMASEPRVTAVVANWNGAEDLQECLPTLLSQSYRPLETIVVDNASRDGSAAVAQSFGVRWLGLDRNRGLAGALNQGAEAASGEFVLFLNNDMRFHEKFVERMVAEIVGDPSIFSVDALQYDWEGVNKVHLATSLTLTCGEKFDDALVPGLFIRQRDHSTATPVLMSSAANMLARKSMFRELGGFDERLPIGYEDVELCWRAWIRGWKSVYVPAAICWHRVAWSARSTEGVGIRYRGTVSGRLLTSTKLLPFKYALKTWWFTLAGLARDIVLLRWRRALIRFRALADCVQYLPTLLHERRQLFSTHAPSPQDALDRLLKLTP